MSLCRPWSWNQVARPACGLTGSEVATRFLMSKTSEAPRHVTVKGDELIGRIPSAEIVGPAPEELVESCDDDRQLLSDLASSGESLDLGSGTLHGPHRGPAMEVVADIPLLLPELAGHAGMKVAPEEIKTLLAFSEVDHSGLVRMKGETEIAQDGGRPPLGFFGLLLRSSTARRSRPHSGRLLRCRRSPRPGRKHAGRCWREGVRSPRPGVCP